MNSLLYDPCGFLYRFCLLVDYLSRISLIYMNVTKLNIITKSSNYLYKRSYATTKPFIRPRLFTQQIVLTNGATYTLRTTSPKPRIKLIKDTRNHPLWNPSQLSQSLDDDSGQLNKFIKKFGDEEYDLEFMESDENLPDLSSNDFKTPVLSAVNSLITTKLHLIIRALRMITQQFLPCLSQNYLSALTNNDSEFDVIIKIGEGNNYKEFDAHSFVLFTRSIYFRTALSKRWVKKQDNKMIFHKPNISPKVFEILLKYIYGGIVEIDTEDPEEILDLLIASDELCFVEILDYLQEIFLEPIKNSLQDYIVLIINLSLRHPTFNVIKQYVDFTIKFSPHIIFFSKEFYNLDQEILESLLKRDDIMIKEIQLWDCLLEWCKFKVELNNSKIDEWDDIDFIKLKESLQPFIKYIRFSHMTTSDFTDKVLPYRPSVEEYIYDIIKKIFFTSIRDMIRLSFNFSIEQPKRRGIDSLLININECVLISCWIDNRPFNYYSFSTFPYDFHLLFRASRDGFNNSTFHELCDMKGPTLTVIRVEGTNELIGGYNPLDWHSPPDWVEGITRESFIFKIDSQDHEKSILSKPYIEDSVANKYDNGPDFRDDLTISGSKCHCEHFGYNKRIRSTGIDFVIADYEVFRIVKS
ncbi:hypothetical protein GLOIN_2v1780055 [Rhizophagus clarus]|uniref:BTB domain-containing protein n=1 Tax=Rhizophagus clarus TaxID=94130 RepID=A0A8H3M094_9GLOM|nr:hypothetical protein GLOIN_2v1780055 [Rhizophagus clarus]